jgi:hypothetical protein
MSMREATAVRWLGLVVEAGDAGGAATAVGVRRAHGGRCSPWAPLEAMTRDGLLDRVTHTFDGDPLGRTMFRPTAEGRALLAAAESGAEDDRPHGQGRDSGSDR